VECLSNQVSDLHLWFVVTIKQSSQYLVVGTETMTSGTCGFYLEV